MLSTVEIGEVFSGGGRQLEVRAEGNVLSRDRVFNRACVIVPTNV